MDKADQILKGIMQENITQEKIKITQVGCDINQALKLFHGIGGKMIKDYSIDKNNQDQIKELLLYFTGNKETKLDFKKGIMLNGNIGTGKTLIMKIIKYLNYSVFVANRFTLISSRELVKAYQLDGFKGVEKHTGTEYMKGYPVLCIDDIGSGIENVNYYGTQSNIIAEVLLDRYDIFCQSKKLTHITTNLTADEIESRYGDRIRSRMREMFNMIQLKGNDRRK